MKTLKTLAVVMFALMAGCNSPSHHRESSTGDEGVGQEVQYAKSFSINLLTNGAVVDVYNPWQGSTGVKYRYAFTENADSEDFKHCEAVIPMPVKRVVCLSTTHIAFLEKIGELDCVVGVSGAQFVSNPQIRRNIELGLVKDVGYEQLINYELLVELRPDIVLCYGVGSESVGYLQKLKSLNIPVVFIAEYLEEDPLGKAEWIKVFGAMFGKYDEACTIFSQIERDYLDVKESLAAATHKPKVFINLPWQDAWFFPGNQSYMAALIDDAGGHYILSHLEGNQSYPLNFEVALAKGMTADVWINTGTALSLADISREFPRTTLFPAYKEGRVFNNNSRINVAGGNDFWESGAVNPHLILRDLARIFYPQSGNHELVYYKRLK